MAQSLPSGSAPLEKMSFHQLRQRTKIRPFFYGLACEGFYPWRVVLA